nr:MAG TPA: hypothetical protein [Caudoviricetes sp.]
MAAPSATSWGSVVGGYGRIGIYISASGDATTTRYSVQIWFWSKYSVSDTGNTIYWNDGSTSASVSHGSVSVKTTVASGSGWSTSNQILLASTSYSYARGTSNQTKYFAAKLVGIDRVGGTMTHYVSMPVGARSSYKITYNANGGTGAPGAQTKWYGTNLALSSTKPTRTGYTFQGWATSSTSSTVSYKPGATYTGNAALNLYAVWKANTFAVKYDANGGTGAPADQTKTYGVDLKLSSTKPTKTNYNFLGWGTSAASTTVAYAAGATYTGNAAITLYAIWELAYVAPRITNYTVDRCTSNGTISEEGTYAIVNFKWATDKTVTGIKIEYKAELDTAWTNVSVTGTGTSGTVSKIIGSSLSTEFTYNIRITVTDSLGSSSNTKSIAPMTFAIDFLKGGKGVAMGKPAAYSDRFDLAWNMVMSNGTGADGSGVIYGRDPVTGDEVAAFQPQNENGNVVIGHGAYARKSGHTNIYSGENIAFYPGGNSKSAFYVNGATGRGYMQRQTDVGMTFTHATTNMKLGVGVGSGGTNRGIHDSSEGSWIVYRNASNTTVVVTSSDARLKDNLGEIPEDEMYALLSGMKPVNFIYKNDEDGVIQNGFIAQNVRDVLIDNDIGYRSYLLIEDADGGDGEIHNLNASEDDVKYSLDYSKFTPILVAGWQYHEKKIKDLEARIEELEKKLGGGC